VVWLRIGNGSVNEMEVALRRHAPEIIGFLGTPTARVLELG